LQNYAADGTRVRELMIRLFKILSPLSTLVVVLLPAGCADKAATLPPDAAVPVLVSQVRRESIPIELHAIGTGQAFKTVSVESQVAGIINAVHYRPGQYVRTGDLLVTLDDRPFLAALAQAQAALNRDKAQAQLNQAELARYRQMFQAGIASHEQYDQFLATAAASNAVVNADEAAIQTAKIQLSYCSIFAPISGIIGQQLIYPGASVKANDLPVLAIINQVSPLYVTFSVPQQYLEPIRASMPHSRLAVQATPSGSDKPEAGYLTFINNTVDSATGTIQLMAEFPNPGRRLWPGEFSNVVLRLGKRENVLVLPAQAVQTGQQGDYVFVVKPDMMVAVRLIKVARTVTGLTEIQQGLAEGETVVIDGQIRLAPGSKVYFKKSL
jgi:multidrug efflux system membrane fusion protein